MMKECFFLEGTNVQTLYVRRYEDAEVSEKKGVVQILHGMAEYGDRYDLFAEFLTKNGFIVYVHDHRKHGKSVSADQKVGYFDTDTWKDMVADIDCVQQEIINRENVSKVIMIGHSMGSLLLRNYLFSFGTKVSKAVIIGTAATEKALSKTAVLLGRTYEKISPNKPNDVLNNLTVGKFSKLFTQNPTGLGWLTRDDGIVNAYAEDPLCGYSYTPRFYSELAKGVLEIWHEEQVKKTPKIPLLFLAGDKDPVGAQGEGVKKVVSLYKNLGYQADIKLYSDARHEILNEINKEDVFSDILAFIEGIQVI